MSRLIGAPKATTLAGFQVQTSQYGRPIAIVYGTTRLAGNLIQMPTQPALKNSHQSKASRATKGAAGGELYSAPVLLALCEGPIPGIGSVWRDKDTKVDFAAVYQPNGWQLSVGTLAPTAWAVPAAAQQLGYQFTAWVANAAVDMPSGSLSQYSWEVQGFLRFNPGGGIVDASPADILPDLLTSAQYGVGFGSAQMGVLTAFQNYCAAAGLFCSPSIDTQRPAADWINELLEVANSAFVWSDGKAKFIPYGDTSLTGNGHTYTPNTTPLYDLTDADFLPRSGDLDPIAVTRTDPATAINQVSVEYLDRTHDYNVATYTAQDQRAIDLYGAIPLTLTLHSITTAQVAQQVAQLRLQREQYVRNAYAFRLGFRYSLLEPMDLVTLTDIGLGLSKTPVRLTEITEGADEQGFDVIAEEWPFGTASATLYSTPNPTGAVPNANVDPGNTATPTITEAPDALKTSPLDLFIAASGGVNWGGCDVYVATDNVNFSKVGRIVGAAAMGTLTATLNNPGNVWPVVDNVDTLAVDITASGRALASYSATDFSNLVPTCYVGGEWCAFENAALVSAGHYNLTTLYRALFSSPAGAHVAGVKFFLLDATIGRIQWPQGKAGQTIFVKLPAFNIYGAALQDVSSVSSFSYTIQNNPLQFQNATPQGTVSIDTNGNWGFASNGPSNAQSARWLASTAGYPADATVAATGNLITGGRTISVTSGGTIAFGQTVFITVVWFDSASGNGHQLLSANIQSSFQTFSATKTVFFSAGSFKPAANGQTYSYNNGNLENDGTATTAYDFNAAYQIPQGCTLIGATNHAFSNAARGIGHTATVALTIFSLDASGGAPTGLSVMGASAIGWQDVASGALSVSTNGLKILMNTRMSYVDAASDGLFGWASLTYTMPDPKQSL